MSDAERTTFWVVWCPDGRSPTVKHWSRKSADNEAKRLAKSIPDTDFFVLKAGRGFRGQTPPEPVKLTMIFDPIPF